MLFVDPPWPRQQLAKHVAVVATELVAFGLCDNANIRRAVELTKGLLSVSRA